MPTLHSVLSWSKLSIQLINKQMMQEWIIAMFFSFSIYHQSTWFAYSTTASVLFVLSQWTINLPQLYIIPFWDTKYVNWVTFEKDKTLCYLYIRVFMGKPSQVDWTQKWVVTLPINDSVRHNLRFRSRCLSEIHAIHGLRRVSDTRWFSVSLQIGDATNTF